MSSKGQIVIPEEIRKRLGLETGSQFIVVAEMDTVVMKAISPPTIDEFDTLIAEARRQAAEAGLTQNDLDSVIADVRSGK